MRVYVKDPLTNFQLTEFSELKEESKNWVSFKSLKDVPVEETYKYPDEKHVSELLSVEELLTELNKWAKGENSLLAPTNEGAIEFVCFVNEYYYQSIMPAETDADSRNMPRQWDITVCGCFRAYRLFPIGCLQRFLCAPRHTCHLDRIGFSCARPLSDELTGILYV